MGREHQQQDKVAKGRRRDDVEGPEAPTSPMPLPAQRMMVGHAEDHAEADADRRADAALGRLQALGADTHQHGPGCGHVRRSATTAGSAVVGYEGGALDAGTSAEIEGRRGGGRPLDGPVLSRMQTAFGADLSGVRVHADPDAARLSRMVSARAFTTGKDVFFGAGEYAPDTAEGERVLAHELAHTLQSGSGAHRLHRLMSGADFQASTGKRSKNRKSILKIDKALADVAGATSVTVALDQVIQQCQAYLDGKGRDKSKSMGVRKLMGQAMAELMIYRMRARMPLPEFVFRSDERAPDAIAQTGFQPWKPTGAVSLIEHVTGALETAQQDKDGLDLQAGGLTKKTSQFVSTSANMDGAKDPTLIQGLLNKYYYKISTDGDEASYTDVSKTFDEAERPNPYEKQNEFAKTGGVPPENIVAFVHGRDLIEFALGNVEADAIPWKPMPVV
jgi:hypothetical protein